MHVIIWYLVTFWVNMRNIILESSPIMNYDSIINMHILNKMCKQQGIWVVPAKIWFNPYSSKQIAIPVARTKSSQLGWWKSPVARFTFSIYLISRTLLYLRTLSSYRFSFQGTLVDRNTRLKWKLRLGIPFVMCHWTHLIYFKLRTVRRYF